MTRKGHGLMRFRPDDERRYTGHLAISRTMPASDRRGPSKHMSGAFREMAPGNVELFGDACVLPTAIPGENHCARLTVLWTVPRDRTPCPQTR